MKNLVFLILFISTLLSSCHHKIELNDIQINDLKGNSIKIHELLNKTCSVIIFFSPECPLSENYTLTTSQLHEKYFDDNITFLAVIPGKSYTMEEIRIFENKYNLSFPIYLDAEKTLCNNLGATITPECYVLNKDNKVIYHGAIDNWAVDLGKKRRLVTEHYLDNAIQHVLTEIQLKKSYVEAVGCFIE